MPASLYRVRDVGNGFLAVMAAPDPRKLEKSLRSLRQEGVDVIVSLLEPYEAEMIGLNRERRLCEKLGIEFISFPIADYKVPDDIEATRDLLERTTRRLHAGKGVAFHCFAGIGRTGVVAAGQLIMLGATPEGVFDVLSDARGTKMPATEQQLLWVHRHRGAFAPRRYMRAIPPGKGILRRRRSS